jgi:primosomal protein N'
MILRAPPEPDFRAARRASPNYVRCPASCDPATGCAHCLFWGTVPKDSPDATCTHVLEHVGRVGRCLTAHRCTRCGATITIDSSG